MILYTVYRTTNKINGMFYIGVHKTTEPQDAYLGSGKRLKYAIKKYGVEAFEKEILHVFEDADEAFVKEKELITEEILDSGKCYNLKLGGEGGWDFINKNEELRIAKNRKAGRSMAAKIWKNPDFVLRQQELKSKRLSELNSKFNRERNKRFLGISLKEETKRKIGEANSIHQSGSKNSQFGTMWITDGILNKKIKKDQEIPEGWKKGRI